MKSQPTDFQRIYPYSPHRPPMIWIDEVVEYGADRGEALVRIKSDAGYMDKSGVRASSCLEFIAQAYGYTSIAWRIYEADPNAKPLKRAFLAAIKNARFCTPDRLRLLTDGDVLHVRISDVRSRGSLTTFTGRVFRSTELLCEAQMTVFSES